MLLKLVSNGLKFLTAYLAVAASLKGTTNTYSNTNDPLDFDEPCGTQLANPCSTTFNVVKGQPTTTTTRWLLAELHPQGKETAQCMEHIADELGLTDFRVLFESVPAGMEVPCSVNHITAKPNQHITCMGWDSPQGMDLMYDVLAENGGLFLDNMHEFHEQYQKVMHNPKATSSVDKYLQQLFTISYNDYDKSRSRDYTVSDYAMRIKFNEYKSTIHWILEQRKQGLSYFKIFNHPLLEQLSLKDPSPAVKKMIQDACKLRNESLLKTLRANDDGKVTLVKGGRGHFFPAHPWEDCESQLVHKELEKDEEKNPHVILSLK